MPEFHDLAEVALNDEGESWGNLGYWLGEREDEQSYSDACRALARVLADKIGLDAQSHVMDVGFGCGDQLLVWLNEYKASSVRGINFSKSQTQEAKQKLASQGYQDHAAKLVYGSANDQSLWHQLSAHSSTTPTSFNRVLALDCAYHFPDRSDFFSQAHRHMAATGKIGLTDFVLDTNHHPLSNRLKLQTMLKLSRIPRHNMLLPYVYREQLSRAGFENIDISDISDAVMPRFKRWFKRFKQQYQQTKYRNMPWQQRLKYQSTADFLDWAFKHRVLRYVLVTAQKA